MGPKLKGRVPTGSWNSQALTPEFYFYQLSFASSASPSLPATNSQSGGVSRCGALQWKCKHIFYNEHMGSSSWKEFRSYPKHVIGYDCRKAGSRRNQEAWRQEGKDVCLTAALDPECHHGMPLPLSHCQLVLRSMCLMQSVHSTTHVLI